VRAAARGVAGQPDVLILETREAGTARREAATMTPEFRGRTCTFLSNQGQNTLAPILFT